MSERRILWGKLTLLSLAALGVAVAAGVYGIRSNSDFVQATASMLKPVGAAWLLALQVVVVPLLVTQLLLAVLGTSERRLVGRLGLRTLAVIVPFLVVIGIVTLVVMGPVARLIDVDPATVAAIRADTVVPDSALGTSGSPPGSWYDRLNMFAAATSSGILPLLVLALFLGFALSLLPPKLRDRTTGLTRALSSLMHRIVAWIMWLTPIAVFALVLKLTLEIGGDTLGLLWFYVVIVSGWMLTVTAALYPISAGLGKMSVLTFARAVAPAQMVAIGTRSSLMSLPALVEGGREHLRLSEAATGFVLPLCASIFKMSSLTTSPVRYLFLSHLFGLPITLESAATFLAISVLLSFSIVGIPGGGSGFNTLPAFMAVGIPIEGLVLVVAVDTIPDIAKTLINVTSYMSIAAIVTRRRLGRD